MEDLRQLLVVAVSELTRRPAAEITDDFPLSEPLVAFATSTLAFATGKFTSIPAREMTLGELMRHLRPP